MNLDLSCCEQRYNPKSNKARLLASCIWVTDLREDHFTWGLTLHVLPFPACFPLSPCQLTRKPVSGLALRVWLPENGHTVLPATTSAVDALAVAYMHHPDGKSSQQLVRLRSGPCKVTEV